MSGDKFNPVAAQIPFDNSTNGFTATDTQEAIEEAKKIPEYASDPVSPTTNEVWVLRTMLADQGSPIGLLLSLTNATVINNYKLSYKTISGTIVRADLN